MATAEYRNPDAPEHTTIVERRSAGSVLIAIVLLLAVIVGGYLC